MTNKELWAKEFKRITRIAKGIAKGTNIEFKFPKQPKRIEKKSIERLRRITPATIRELIKDEVVQAKKAKVQIDITKAARPNAPEEAKQGYRFQAITPEERARRAKKAAATRLRKGIKPFGEPTEEERSERAKKAAATRAAKGIKPFGNATPEQRKERAKKAAATRKAKGIKPFSNMTPEQRSARAKKAAATRKANKLKRLKEDSIEIVDEQTGEISEQPIDEEEVPTINEYKLIIDNYLSQLNDYQGIHPQAFFINTIVTKLYDFISQFGEKKVAIALAKMADEGILVTVLVVYDMDGAGYAYLGKMISFLIGNGVLTDEEGLQIYNEQDTSDSGYFDYSGGVEEEQEYLNRTYVWTDGV